jgi:polypeptide N-acetylgalactosaminyltransferase
MIIIFVKCLFRLEPLVARIQESRRAVLCPIIAAIDARTLEYSTYTGLNTGGFSWSLHFTWEEIPQRELKRIKASTDLLR